MICAWVKMGILTGTLSWTSLSNLNLQCAPGHRFHFVFFTSTQPTLTEQIQLVRSFPVSYCSRVAAAKRQVEVQLVNSTPSAAVHISQCPQPTSSAPCSSLVPARVRITCEIWIDFRCLTLPIVSACAVQIWELTIHWSDEVEYLWK